VAGSLSIYPDKSQELAARADAAADGRFTVALPEAGTYAVAFSSEAFGIRNARASVEFGEGETAVRLPTTRLSGAVTFVDGLPAKNAIVVLERTVEGPTDELPGFHENVPTATADATGRFLVRGLEPGTYEVTARLGARKSDTRRIVTTAVDPGSVQLLIPDAEGLFVWLLDGQGHGVPLAHGWLLAGASGSGSLPQTATIQTDDEGGANVPVAWSPGTLVHVLLTGSEHPTTALRGSASNEGVVTLRVPETSGELRLALPQPAHGQPDPLDLRNLALVGDRGALLPLSLLSEMGLATSVTVRGATRVLIPTLASGEWRLGRFPDARALFQAFGTGASPEILKSFTVPPGGSVGVEIR
jgi:hypothetical protein